MKTLLIALSLAAFFALPCRSQDSLYYVHLQNGTTVYSKKVKLVNSLTRGKVPAPGQQPAQLKVAGTNLHVAIGLLAAGAGTIIGGFIVTHQRNTDAYNTYKQQSAAWYANGNVNAPMPTLPHYGLSPLFYVGSAMVLSGFIPIFNVRKHLVKALDIYNGVH